MAAPFQLQKICTQIRVAAEYQQAATKAALLENALNAQTTSGSLPSGSNGAAHDAGRVPLNMRTPSPNGHPLPTGGMGLAINIGRMWKPGRTLKVYCFGGESFIKKKVIQYANEWRQYANINFEFVDALPADIRVDFQLGGGSWSFIGTDCIDPQIVPEASPTMNFGWLTEDSEEEEIRRVILHEFGHALGCIHEHQNPTSQLNWNKKEVYEYYLRTNGWDQFTVDFNLFQSYAAYEVYNTEFDWKSIMLYSFPASLMTDGKGTPMNTNLSELDKSFIAAHYPRAAASQIGGFHTNERNDWSAPAPKTSSVQAIARPVDDSPPSIAPGLNWIDVGNGADIHIEAEIVDLAAGMKNFEVNIKSWGETVLYGGGCTWVEIPSNSAVAQTGTFRTSDYFPIDGSQKYMRQFIQFPRPFKGSRPEVVVWISMISMSSDYNWRLKTSAVDVQKDGFTIVVETWADSLLYNANVTWIAYDPTKNQIIGGNFRTNAQDHASQQSGKILFPSDAGKTTKYNQIGLGINELDFDCNTNLRLRVSKSNVTDYGMTWHLDTWWDSLMYDAGGAYIALSEGGIQ